MIWLLCNSLIINLLDSIFMFNINFPYCMHNIRALQRFAKTGNVIKDFNNDFPCWLSNNIEEILNLLRDPPSCQTSALTYPNADLPITTSINHIIV